MQTGPFDFDPQAMESPAFRDLFGPFTTVFALGFSFARHPVGSVLH